MFTIHDVQFKLKIMLDSERSNEQWHRILINGGTVAPTKIKGGYGITDAWLNQMVYFMRIT